MVSNKQRFGRYEVIGTIGQGQMGRVYRARDPELERVVAIKTIQSDNTEATIEMGRALESFRREAQLAARVRHPNMAAIFEVDFEGQRPYIVMEYIAGQDLSQILACERVLPPRRALRYLEHLAGAVDAAHAKGVLHRDIKPANIIITEEDQAFLVDFGVASLGGVVALLGGEPVVGTPGYMSPEQILQKNLTRRSDLFSFAVVAFEMFTGQRPFPGTDYKEVLRLILEEPPTPMNTICQLPLALEAEFERALCKDSLGRFSTAGNFVAALRQAFGTSSKNLENKPAKIIQTLPHNVRTGTVLPPWIESDSHTPANLQPVEVEKTSHTEDPADSETKIAPSIPIAIKPTNFNNESVRQQALPPALESFRSSKTNQMRSIHPRLLLWLGLVLVLLAALLGILLWTTTPQTQPGVNRWHTAMKHQYQGQLRNVSALNDEEVRFLLHSAAEPSERKQQALEEALHRNFSDFDVLTSRALQSNEPRLRVLAVELIGKSNHTNAVTVLIGYLADANPDVRLAVAQALALRGNLKIVGYLRQRWVDETDDKVRAALQETIEKIEGVPLEEKHH